MMLIKLFLFFLVLLILPDMYIYKAYIRRVSQKWTHWAYWLPSLFLLLGMTLVFSIHEPRPDSMQRLSNFLLIFLCIILIINDYDFRVICCPNLFCLAFIKLFSLFHI